MVFGYARVSTEAQDLSLQVAALKKEGCHEIVSEKVSGKKFRPELQGLLERLQEGDVLMVYSLDRLGRTAKDLISLIDLFRTKGIHFKSLKEGIFDTSSPMGRAIFEIMAILKAMEVEVLSERTKDGLKAAREKGRIPGRPLGSINTAKAAAAVHLYLQGKHSVSQITKELKISRSTFYRYINQNQNTNEN